MKKIFLFALVISCSIATAFAQLSPDDVSLFQSLYGKDKREVVKQYLSLTEAQSPAFWTLYDEYETARKEIGKKRIQILETYAKNYATLTDATADNLVSDMLAQTEAMTKLQAKYYGKMKKVIPPLKAAQFIQIESYLDNAMKTAVAEKIPFIGDMERDN